MVTVGGGQIHTVSSGQTDAGDIVLAGGTEIDAGLTIKTTISSGGYELVSAGAESSKTTIYSSGTMAVYGTAIGTIINGGVAYVFWCHEQDQGREWWR